MMNKKIISYLFPALVSLQLLSASLAFAEPVDQEFNFGAQQIESNLQELDQASAKKWEQLEDWQRKESWINEQLRLGVVGVVYEKGFFGTTVSRNIVPDKSNGWLVVDKIRVHAGPMLQIGNLAGNLFFAEYFPYLQVGAQYGRNFINVRAKSSYKEALMASPFKFSRIPVNAAATDAMETGEIVSTVTEGGFFVRASASVFDLVGASIHPSVGIGPRAKVHVSRQLKLTVAKQQGKEVLVMLERVTEKGLGIGLAAGVVIDDLIDAPVSIGINQGGGYSPLRVNYKVKNENVKSIIYRIDTGTRAGEAAYQLLMKRDFTLADDLADRKSSSVTRELVREGEIDTSEFNLGLDLIFFRSGYRNIFKEAKFNSELANGKKFQYIEFSANRIKEVSSWVSGRQADEKYSALVPLSKEGNAIDTFILDSMFSYSDEETDGNDLRDMVRLVRETVNHLPVKVKHIDPAKNYGQVRAIVTVRFPADAIRELLNTSEKRLWTALAISSGLPNPRVWSTYAGRRAYVENDKTLQRDSQSGDIKSGRNFQKVEEAKFVRDFIRYKLKSSKYSVAEKAKMLVQFLRANNESKLLHRTMIELVGRDQVLIRGRLKGSVKREPLPARKFE